MRNRLAETLCLLALASLPAHAEPYGIADFGLEIGGRGLVYTRRVTGAFEQTTLDPDKSREIVNFITSLGDDRPLADSALSKIAESALKGSTHLLDDPAPDGAIWFERKAGAYRITQDGRKAIPAILLGIGTEAGPTAPTKARQRVELRLAAMQDPNFDNAAARRGSTTQAPLGGIAAARRYAAVSGFADGGALYEVPSPQDAKVPEDAIAQAPKAQERSGLQNTLFWSSFAVSQAGFAADVYTTNSFLNHGIGEGNFIYVMTGLDRYSKAKVLGSAVVTHVAYTGAAVGLHYYGKGNNWIEAAAIGINLVSGFWHGGAAVWNISSGF